MMDLYWRQNMNKLAVDSRNCSFTSVSSNMFTDIDAINRPRLRSRLLGSGVMEGGRPAGTICQDNIKEDFFQGGSNSWPFAHRYATTQSGAESTSSEHTSSSRQSCPGRVEPLHVSPIGPVWKMEHSLNVKGEESLADDQFSPGCPSQGPKRRQNQQKRIVCVPAAASGRPNSEGVPSDLWAWRKYGQKPIKGSPFPRGYYKCSSSKGCFARKQVERSRTDPSMFIITYTAEHNHPWPSHRSPSARSSRSKGGSSSAEELEKTDAGADAAEPDGPGSVLNSPEFHGIVEESEHTSDTLATAMVMVDHITDKSEAFVFDSDRDCRSSINMQDSDFFAHLGEFPDTTFTFGRTGLVEDPPEDDESRHLGMDDVDPYNLFGWASKL